MKELTVRRIDNAIASAADVAAVMEAQGIERQVVDVVNWADFPYVPSVHFQIAHNDKNILLHWEVEEEGTGAVEVHDNGRVWEDSCVEFFLSPDSDDTYYNLECNCIGTALLGGGRVNTERPHLSLSRMPQIHRWASLGYQPVVPELLPRQWQLSIILPVDCLFLHRLPSLGGRQMRANFYKCGDLLPTPHYLSWSPISTPTPSYHQPQFFGTIRFE